MNPSAAAGPLTAVLVLEQLWQPAPGGSGTYIRELVTGLLNEREVAVRGLAAWHTSAPDPAWVPDPRLAVDRVRLPRRALYELWNRARVGPDGSGDVVHATTWAIPPRRRRLVVTVHDLAFLRTPEHFTPHGVVYFRRALDIVRAEADQVIAVSETTAADCADAGIETSRIRVVPHGVRIPVVDVEAVRRFRTRHHLERPYVMWCGTVEPRKNLTTLVRAYREIAALTDLDLVLVGPPGWGATNDEVARLLSELPEGRVHRLGSLPFDELHAAYAGATVFAFPSLWEGFGMPVLEAMAHGVPVVTSRDTSMAEVAGDAALLVDPTDADELAAGVLQATAEGCDLGERGRRRAAGFTWSAAARKTASAYRAAAEL